MNRNPKNKEGIYLRKKMELYESFLFHFLPQITSLSYITRFNIYDAFGPFGTDRSGSQGTSSLIFDAMRKQRQHQLHKKLPLKPFAISLLHPMVAGKTYQNALENLQQKNSATNTCKIDSWPGPIKQALSKVRMQRQQQPASEKHLLMLDPLGIPQLSLDDLLVLAEKKVELLICLPLLALWQLHSKPGKGIPEPEVVELKSLLDKLFPAEHPYWEAEIKVENFKQYLKEAFSKEAKLFTAMEPADTEIPEVALLAISSDAFIMEKVLQGLQALRATNTPPAGQQLGIFEITQSAANHPTFAEEIVALLKEEPDNQQLYLKGLRAGMLPQQVLAGLQYLLEAGSIEITDDRKKDTINIPANCLSYTAFKAAKPVCIFKLRE